MQIPDSLKYHVA